MNASNYFETGLGIKIDENVTDMINNEVSFVKYCYSRAIRYEAKEKGVQVCTLCPGATRTNFFAQEGTKTPRSAMTAEEVAGYAYKRFIKNKDITIPGFVNRIKNWFPMKVRIMFDAKMKKVSFFM